MTVYPREAVVVEAGVPGEPTLLTALREDAPAALDPIAVRVLDAAYVVMCRVGAHRMTMDEVAREAGISRITVYRRFAGKDDLVGQVVTREFRRYFDQFRTDVAQGRTAADRVVLGFVSSLRTMRDNPVIGGLMTGERGLFLTSLLAEGATLDAVRGFVAHQLRREQAAGQVAATVDPEFVAEIMVRLCTSFLISPSTLIDLDDEDALARVARAALVPLIDRA